MQQQQQQQTAQNTPYVHQQQYGRCRPRSGKPLLITGGLILTIGIIEFVANFIGYFLRYNVVAYFSSGIWVGIILIITGSFGVAAGLKKNNVKCLIISYMVLCIISAVCDIAIIGQASTGVAVNVGYSHRCNRWSSPTYSNYNRRYVYNYECRDVEAKLAFHIIMLLLGLAVGVIAIIGSVLSCKRSCSCCGYIEPTVPGAFSGAQLQFGGGAQNVVLIPANSLGQPTTVAGHPGQQFYQVQIGAQQPHLQPVQQPVQFYPQQQQAVPGGGQALPQQKHQSLYYQQYVPATGPPQYSESYGRTALGGLGAPNEGTAGGERGAAAADMTATPLSAGSDAAEPTKVAL